MAHSFPTGYYILNSAQKCGNYSHVYFMVQPNLGHNIRLLKQLYIVTISSKAIKLTMIEVGDVSMTSNKTV